METKLTLNVKNMVDAYALALSSSDDEANTVWDSFYTLHNFGFITRETWNRFYDNAHDLSRDGEGIYSDNGLKYTIEGPGFFTRV